MSDAQPRSRRAQPKDDVQEEEILAVDPRNMAMAPGEVRIAEKMLGHPMREWGETSGGDQLQVSVFITLRRRYPDEDPSVLWARAEWTPVRFSDDAGGLLNPPNAAG